MCKIRSLVIINDKKVNEIKILFLIIAGDYVRSDYMSSVSWSVERRLAKISRQHGALPEVTFLHAWIRSTYCQG